jgi:hypothetical protein
MPAVLPSSSATLCTNLAGISNSRSTELVDGFLVGLKSGLQTQNNRPIKSIKLMRRYALRIHTILVSPNQPGLPRWAKVFTPSRLWAQISQEVKSEVYTSEPTKDGRR